MSDIFVSYARSTERQAKAVAEALRALGYQVWRDDELPANRAYAEVIEERIDAAKAVVVIWSEDASKSVWVRSEAERAREGGKLVQVVIDAGLPPMPFDQIHAADLSGWSGDLDAPGWRKVVSGVADLTGWPDATVVPAVPTRSPIQRLSICVLPFANMSGDAAQEYFNDGISEDIITDLSKVSALSVVSRQTAFSFKGKSVNVRLVARQLGVGYILEGSVRKVGDRVRISAQLIEASRDSHIWAERYDRALENIFALQDEIAQAIVAALKLKLLPREKAAIERRGTTSLDAYNLYLMAHAYSVNSDHGDVGGLETILRLCRRATEIDPNYAQAWALTALAQLGLHFKFATAEENGLVAADRALSLDPDLAMARAVKARHLSEQGRDAEALAEIEIALRLEPESYEVNATAGFLSFKRDGFRDAIGYYEKAAAALDSDIPGMLIDRYAAIGDQGGVRRAAQMTLSRSEKALGLNPDNESAMTWGLCALAALGEAERASDWIDRCLLINPDSLKLRYDFACALSARLKNADGALAQLGPYLERAPVSGLDHAKTDPDLDFVRADSRFVGMMAAAEARLTVVDKSAT
jgi:adenylate cyclase